MTAKSAAYARKPNRMRHSASSDGATPALNAALAMIPPMPKQEAAVNASV